MIFIVELTDKSPLMTELVDVLDLGSSVERRVGSSPTKGTHGALTQMDRVLHLQCRCRGFESLMLHNG